MVRNAEWFHENLIKKEIGCQPFLAIGLEDVEKDSVDGDAMLFRQIFDDPPRSRKRPGLKTV